MRIRDANPDDLPAMMDLAAQEQFAAHWSHHQYQAFLQGLSQSENDKARRLALILAFDFGQQGSEICGFLMAKGVGSEWEIENLVVQASHRRRGLAGKLMQEFLSRIKAHAATQVFLEVRSGNAAARFLYKKFSFQEVGLRPQYYRDPPDDAALYRLYMV